MSDSRTPSRALDFDVYRLEDWANHPRRFRLLCRGREVLTPSETTGKPRPLAQGPLKVLEYLASNAHKRRERKFEEDEILTDVWGEATPVVSNVVEKAIGKLRAALKDATVPIIEGIHGIGYQFIPQVTILTRAQLEAEAEDLDVSPHTQKLTKTQGEPFQGRWFSSDQAALSYVADKCERSDLKTVYGLAPIFDTTS